MKRLKIYAIQAQPLSPKSSQSIAKVARMPSPGSIPTQLKLALSLSKMNKSESFLADSVARPKRVRWLDGLRGIGAVQVCLFHLVDQFSLASGRHTILSIIYDGPLAVFLFFCISGFAVTRWYEALRAPAWKVIIARAGRLFIPTAAACLLAAIIWEIFRGIYPQIFRERGLPISITPYAKNLVADIFLFVPILGHRDSSLFSSLPVVGSIIHSHAYTIGLLWTINIEFYGSLLVIALVFTARRFPDAIAWLLLPVAFLVTSRSLLLPFVFGYAVSHMRNGERSEMAILPWVPLTLIFAAAIVSVDATNYYYYPLFEHISRVDYIIPAQSLFSIQKAAAAMIIFFGIYLSTPIKFALETPICQALGRISFQLYLVHFPMLFVFIFVRDRLHSLGAADAFSIICGLVAFLASVAAAIHVFSFVDRFSINFGRLVLRPTGED
jgi:peptidoglycan/LPS O-acetylase OafA/YrhL